MQEVEEEPDGDAPEQLIDGMDDVPLLDELLTTASRQTSKTRHC